MNPQLYSQVSQLGHSWLTRLFQLLVQRYRGLDMVADTTAPFDEQMLILAKALQQHIAPDYVNIATVEQLMLIHCDLLRFTVKDWDAQQVDFMDFVKADSLNDVETLYMNHSFDVMTLSHGLTDLTIKTFVRSLTAPLLNFNHAN